MSKKFLVTVITLLTLFGGLMTWLFYQQGALLDSVIRCTIQIGTTA